MNVLHVTNAWPSQEKPVFGTFIKEQIESIQALGIGCATIHAEGGGLTKYAHLIARSAASQRQYDIVHAHHVLTGASVAVAGVPRARLVVSFLNERAHNIAGVSHKISERVEKIVHRRSGASIFKNSSFNEWRRPQDVILPNAVSRELFRPADKALKRRELDLPASAKLCLFVSANDLHRRAKRYDRFQAVLNVLRESDDSFAELTMVSVPHDKAPAFFNAADVLIVCSEYEGSPNAVKEALACGLPVVSVDVGDVRRQIEGVPDCSVLADFDVEQMASCVRAAIKTAIPRATRAESYLSRTSTVRDAAEAIAGIYEGLISSRIRKR